MQIYTMQKNNWVFNFGMDMVDKHSNKWNILNPAIDVIPNIIKDTYKKLFDCDLQFVVKFRAYETNVQEYSICIYSEKQLLAKSNVYLRIINKNVSLAQVNQNIILHRLHFNFNDNRRIFVPEMVLNGMLMK